MQGPEVIPFAIDEEPQAVWGWDLAERNLKFLDSFRPDFFYRHSEWSADHLDGDDSQLAALSLRLSYSHALETFFSLLGALVQCPRCVPAYLLRYRPVQLRSLVEKIRRGKSVHARWRGRITLDALATVVHRGLCPIEGSGDTASIVAGFAGAWTRFSADFVAKNAVFEHNSIKHGLRARPGGFSLAIGIEKIPGVPAAPEDMRPLGGSEFGTSFFAPEGLGDRRNFWLRRVSRNWNPENLRCGIELLAMSITNVVACLKLLAGVDAQSAEFHVPVDKDRNPYESPWHHGVGPLESSLDVTVTTAQATPLTKEQILNSYSASSDDESDDD